MQHFNAGTISRSVFGLNGEVEDTIFTWRRMRK